MVLVTVDKGRVTPRVRDLLIDARIAAGVPAGAARVMQGSFNAGKVGASAGTHDGGGAFDLSIAGLSAFEQVSLVTELRRRNVCAFLRTEPHGWNGAAHIHGIVRDEPSLSTSARKQVVHYDNGNNALAGASRRPDTLPRPKQSRMEEHRMVASKPGPTVKHSGKIGSSTPYYKTPVTKPVTVIGNGKPHVAAVLDLPEGRYLCAFQVRMPAGAGDAEAQIVRLNFPGLAARDSTGHNPVPRAVKLFDKWWRWRSPIEHSISVPKGGGKVSFEIVMPPGTHKMRYVCKATRVA